MPYNSRIPVADEYVAVLGRAAYNFAYLEWVIVGLVERLSPGFVYTVASMAAGPIATKFKHLVQKATLEVNNLDRLQTLAGTFTALVQERNALLHGKPYTRDDGEQRLLYTGKAGRHDWSTRDILDAARAFEEAALEGAELLHRLTATETQEGRK